MIDLATKPSEKIEKLKKFLLVIIQPANLSDSQDFKYLNELKMPKTTKKKIL